ncbi:hypothetical protein Poli38472_003008 [Pythium oligandrum]|uniref:Uncharacterized protein n=1 Tax=Pythium oligandrum TaxID=41045 RepID=A0A8K1C6B4_PYTOL|nr:hypothetical protein Poli38472_003008 [Pythium oligandrum]|eukprot:TMW57083.1 hypothetical protein Poli38472_003008 [Pythium oligandrum]
MGPSIATRASLRKREEAIKRMREDARASRGPAKRRLQDQDEESDDEDDEEEEEDDSSDADYDDRPVKVVARSRCVRSHISPRKHKRIQRSTDRVLTFLQNARMMNIPVRAGKWNEPEENYLRKLVYLFTLGVLDGVENKTSMRSWLSKMLNCCPMRISKKQMHGEKFKGKIKFKKCPDQIERMTQAEYEKSLKEVMKLRSDFLKHWAKEEFSRWNVTERMKGFDSWYEKVLATVPRPRIAKNNRLVEPRLPQMKEGWADVQQQFDLVQLESRTNLMVQQAGPMDTAACVQIEREIRALIINRDQAVYGVEGTDISPNDCKVLVDANILGARSDEEQADLCANPCYSTITDKYRVLLDNECFASTDPDEEASGTLLATAYQIGCQTREDGKHCIALLASLVKDAGRRFDLCSEIVEPLGCCFQSYKQYMKIGTSAASKALDEAQETCTKAGVKDLDKMLEGLELSYC